MVGDTFTLADIIYLPFLRIIFTYILDAEARAQFPNVLRYFEQLVAEGVFQGIIVDPLKFYATKIYELADPEAYEVFKATKEAQAKAKGKGKGKGKAKAKKQAPKKQEKKPKKKKGRPGVP